MSAALVMYLDTSNVIEHKVLDRVNQRPVNSATVTAHLRNAAGADVVGETWPVTLSYVSGSRGVYRYFTSPTMDLTDNGEYELTVVADDGAGHVSTKVKSVVAKVQRC